MSKYVKVALIVALLAAASYFVIRIAKNEIRERISHQIVKKHNLVHKGIKVNLWDGTITIDSLSGFANEGIVEKVKFIHINWYKLYRNNTAKLDQICVNAEGLHLKTRDGFHILEVSRLSKRMADLELFDFKVSPTLDRSEFYKQRQTRKPRFTLDAERISISGISDKPIRTSKVFSEGLKLRIEEDHTLPTSAKKKVMPTELLQGIGANFSIDSMILGLSTIDYHVKNKGRDSWGNISLADVSLNISKISNDSMQIEKDNEMIMELSGQLAGEAPLLLIMKHFLDSPTYHYDVFAQISDFDLRHTNSVVLPSTGLKIESGIISNLEVEGSFYERSGNGTINIDYHNLSVNMERELGGIVKFLGNAMVRNKAKQTASFARDRSVQKSFMAHLWVSILETLKKIALLIPIG